MFEASMNSTPSVNRSDLNLGLIHNHRLLTNGRCSITQNDPVSNVSVDFQGDGAYFNGVNSFLRLATDINFEDTDPFTVSIWFKTNEATRFWCVYRLHFRDVGVAFRGDDGYGLLTGLEDTSDDTWHHLCLSYQPHSNGSHTTILMTDRSVQDYRHRSGSPLSSYQSHELRLGMTLHGGGHFSNVKLREHRIYNRALSIAEMRALNDVTRHG